MPPDLISDGNYLNVFWRKIDSGSTLSQECTTAW